MKTVTPTELRADIYNLLDRILATGEPLEVMRGERRLRIQPVLPVDKFENLVFRPDVIRGDPDDLVTLSWEDEVQIDLP
ncbi:MAG: type II toxin-antitoxin system Phd/YefM family antitoxin [Chloroflexi bacterium]|nr:MAG: type II toxin-antitoxin system Phd/YefM family antitoxin [Chloroflexota bacterium]